MSRRPRRVGEEDDGARPPRGSRAPLAWVLNLDAERELEAGASSTPSATLARATEAARRRLRAMLPDEDVVLGIDPDARARGLEGRCFCPTASALARLGEAGARVPDAPAMAILRRVNERGFALALQFDGALRCTRMEEVERALARPGPWLLKRGFTFAGRGQRPVDRLSEADRAWIRASLRRGALYVEPRRTITLEVALHGLLAPDGSVARGTPTVQRVEAGAWRESRPAVEGELHAHERAQLDASFDRVRARLHQAGYFGPFGIDAFRFASSGQERFQPLSELNARYTMAWGTGMGGWR